MINAIYAETVLLSKRVSTWVLLGVWIWLAVFFTYVMDYTGRDEAQGWQGVADAMPGAVPGTVLTGVPFLGGVIILLFAIISIGGDFSANTLKLIMTQRAGRARVLAAKLTALGLWIIPFMVIPFVACLVASEIIARQVDGPTDLPSATTWLKALAAGWLILAVWGALGALLALITRGTSLAIGLGIMYGLAIEGLITNFLEQVDILQPVIKGMIRTNAYSLIETLGVTTERTRDIGPGSFTGPYVSTEQSLIVLTVYAAAFAVIAGYLLKHRDIT